jgi:hypothetical protein
MKTAFAVFIRRGHVTRRSHVRFMRDDSGIFIRYAKCPEGNHMVSISGFNIPVFSVTRLQRRKDNYKYSRSRLSVRMVGIDPGKGTREEHGLRKTLQRTSSEGREKL